MIKPITSEGLEQMLGWYRMHGIEPMPLDWFGRGWWVPGVAAAFLYLAEGRAYLEDVITNPDASSGDRHDALVELQNHIESEARAAGAKWIVGWSKEPEIAVRAHRAGYRNIGCFCGFVRRLED